MCLKGRQKFLDDFFLTKRALKSSKRGFVAGAGSAYMHALIRVVILSMTHACHDWQLINVIIIRVTTPVFSSN